MTNLVVYEDEHEVLVTTEEREQEAIKEWFTDGSRDIEVYDRCQRANDSAVRIRVGSFVLD